MSSGKITDDMPTDEMVRRGSLCLGRRVTQRFLLCSKRLHGIDGCRAHCRDRAGERGADDEKRDDTHEYEGIRAAVASDMHEQTVQGYEDDNSGSEAADYGEPNAARDDPEHVGALRAQGHADAELVCALRHRVRDDAEETDQRERQGERRKESEENRKQTLLLDLGLLRDPLL